RYVYAEDLKEAVAPKNILVSASVDDVIDQALGQHPALKVAYANIKAAEHKQQRAHSTRYPKIDLRLAKELGSDLNGIPGDTDETSLSLNLTYNFFRGGADKAERQKRVSEMHQQQQFAAKVRRQVINTLRLAWDADQSIAEQLVYLKKHVIKSKETMNSYQEEFFIGQRDLIDLLDAKNELNAAQNRYTDSYYDGISARYRIYEGVGDIFTAIGLEVVVQGDDLVISRMMSNKLDYLPLDRDIDGDGRLDVGDHCDNSLYDSEVNDHGCAREVAPKPVVKRQNEAPVAADDSWTLPQSGLMVISRGMLLNNDYDPDGDMIAIESFTAPVHGYLASTLDDEWVYRAEEGFDGTDTFTYVINDGQVSSEATVNINVFSETDDEVDVAATHYVNFEFGKTELTRQSKVKVQKIVTKLLESPALTINLSTHTDNVGSEAFNQQLSERRAKAVRALLSVCGVEGHRVTAVGRGESQPVAENTTEVGRSINRRGEFRFEEHAAYN
ncbi:TolC family protein, partial [bacterium]|nr:TolC family protein [bacterium]